MLIYQRIRKILKSIIWLVLVVNISVLNYSQVPAQDKKFVKEAVRYIEEGKGHYENQNYYEAVEIWTEVLKLDPWNNEVKILIEKALGKIEELTEKLNEGFELLNEGKVDEAYDSFLHVKNNSSPKSEELYSLLAGGFNSIERVKNKEKYDKIIEQGDRYLEGDKFDPAINLYTYAEKFYPEGDLAPGKVREAEGDKAVYGIRLEAIDYYDTDDFEKSKEGWNSLLELKPGDGEALIYLSKIAFKKSEKERLSALSQSYFDNGVILFKEKKYEESIDQFENSIAMNYQVKESEKYIRLAREAMRAMERLGLEKTLELVAKYLREGIKYYNLDQYKRSLSVLNEGLKLDPQNTQIQEYIIRATIALKREEEKVVPLTSPFYKLIQDLKRLGTGAYEKAYYPKSIKFWEEILLIFPFNETARINLTRSLRKTDPALAQEILVNMYQEARALTRKGKKREAMARLNLVLEVDPNHRDAKALLKELETEKKEEKKVVSREDKKKALDLYNEGVKLYGNEKLADATRVWKEALKLNPEYDEAKISLARVETQIRTLERIGSGETEEAAALDTEKRIKLKKHYLDGINYYMSGLYKEAISEWEEVLKIDPAYENVKQNIERAKKRLTI